MLVFQDRGPNLCDGISRRDWLRIGGLSAFGVGLPNLLQSRSHAASTSSLPDSLKGSFGKAKSCIVLFMLGGPPQHETWDPKPEAPLEVRGDLKPISSATVGLQVGELMPLTAKLTNHIAVLRATATDDNAHSSSGYWMLTGYPHAPKNSENALPGAPNDWPCLGAVVRSLKGDQGSLPGAVRLPEEIWNTGRLPWPGQTAGWLGNHADPWLLNCDPNKSDFRVADIALPMDVSPERLQHRHHLLGQLNRHIDQLHSTPAVDRWNGWQRKALELLRTPDAQRAFALEQESESVRDRYGRNRFGQSVLLARRLVESGVSLVQVNWTRWETDDNMAPLGILTSKTPSD